MISPEYVSHVTSASELLVSHSSEVPTSPSSHIVVAVVHNHSSRAPLERKHLSYQFYGGAEARSTKTTTRNSGHSAYSVAADVEPAARVHGSPGDR